MAQIILETEIEAPPDRVFDLSRSIDLHMISARETTESAVAGRTTGLIELNESVTFRAKHFAVWFEMTSAIVEFNRPNHFRDVMVDGPFKSFVHDHFFKATGNGTMMIDEFDFQSPFGPLGRIVNVLILTNYMYRFLEKRNSTLKAIAEGDQWGKYIT